MRIRNSRILTTGILFVGLVATALNSNIGADPKPEKKEFRRPGFVFVELGTPHVSEYVSYFETVAGFKRINNKDGYAELESDVAQLLLIDPKLLPKGHPFYEPPPNGQRGYSLELGLVVANLDETFAAATKFKDWKISSGIAKRPWGVRDFRVLSPDGYYLRFTE